IAIDFVEVVAESRLRGPRRPRRDQVGGAALLVTLPVLGIRGVAGHVAVWTTACIRKRSTCPVSESDVAFEGRVVFMSADRSSAFETSTIGCRACRLIG